MGQGGGRGGLDSGELRGCALHERCWRAQALLLRWRWQSRTTAPLPAAAVLVLHEVSNSGWPLALLSLAAPEHGLRVRALALELHLDAKSGALRGGLRAQYVHGREQFSAPQRQLRSNCPRDEVVSKAAPAEVRALRRHPLTDSPIY
jgi:hypothetical protein